MGNATRSARNAANIDFDDFLAAQSGQGVPEVEGANFVKLMQSNSPEVDQHPNNKKRVKDIQIGDFLFRGATPEIVRGDEGFLFQPLTIQQAWAEWNADGVNVAKYAARPAEAIGDKMPNGNSIEFTKYIVGALGGDINNIWVIPLKSTGLGVFNREIARALRMAPDFVAKNGQKIRLPLYAHLFKVTSRPDGNAKGSWRAYHFDIVAHYPDGMTRNRSPLRMRRCAHFPIWARPTPSRRFCRHKGHARASKVALQRKSRAPNSRSRRAASRRPMTTTQPRSAPERGHSRRSMRRSTTTFRFERQREPRRDSAGLSRAGQRSGRHVPRHPHHSIDDRRRSFGTTIVPHAVPAAAMPIPLWG
jgi:hypothetical protein